MHEMGIAAEVLRIAEASVPEPKEQHRITRVRVRVGRLSTVVPDSLSFCFDALKEGDLLENAALIIEEVPVRLSCNECGHEWETEEAAFSCPACHGPAITVHSGRELEVASIEIETPDISENR